MSTLPILFAALLVAFLVFKLLAARPHMPATAAQQAIQKGTAVLIDVREPAEWRDGVAAPAALLPLSDLRGSRTRWNEFLAQHRDQQLLVYCHSGMRSASAAAVLRREGFDAINIGGLSSWTRAGLPMRRPETA